MKSNPAPGLRVRIRELFKMRKNRTGELLTMTCWRRILAGFAFLVLLATNLPAQSIYGTLTGVVTDSSQADVPQAAEKLRDAHSRTLRDTVTNNDRYFSY